jgi:Zn-dependent protease with chaperone function
MLSGSVSPLFFPGAILLLPVVLTLCFRRISLQSQEAEEKTIWAAYRAFGRFILAITVASWWVLWDLHGRYSLISVIGHTRPGALETSSEATPLFWVPPIVSLGIFLLLCNTADKTILNLKWTTADTFRQVWWRLMSFVIPLLMVAAGFSTILDGKVKGIGWLLAAGAVSKVGTGFLRRAEGMRFNALKSGETRNRALNLASRMGVTLSRIYVVPAGKGHLTNAYGMSNAIALTDNLGKYLTNTEKDYVIAHELAHVKLKHGRKELLLVVTIFSAMTLLVFLLRQQADFRPLLQLVVMVGPLVALYYCSRRFEYSADREAVDFTGDPETAIRALANLHHCRELPAAHDGFTELFMTHPTFARRIQAIANDGHVPDDRVTDILEDSGIPVSTSPKPTEAGKIPEN